jgi:hypothetical protein
MAVTFQSARQNAGHADLQIIGATGFLSQAATWKAKAKHILLAVIKMDKQKFIISSYPNLVGAFQYAKQFGFDHPYCVEVRSLTRTDPQNKLLHALFGELSHQAKWQNEKLTAEQWKILMISAHAIAEKMPTKMVIGLEGEVVNLRESSAQMSVARLNSLIEYVTAWAAEHGVIFKDFE